MASATVLDRRKRDRSAVDFFDESSYVKSKRVLHDCLRNMSLSERPAETPSARIGGDSIEVGNDDQSICESDVGTKLERLNSVETTASEEESDDDRGRRPPPKEEDLFLAAFKGGRRQYVRKVDYLVDELIRKSQRTAATRPQSYEEMSIPDVVGPHPAVDHALSLLVPPLHTDFHSIAKAESQTAGTETRAGNGVAADVPPTGDDAPGSQVCIRANPSLYSGNVTHGDWEIEELGSNRSMHSPDISEESDMAFCDDWSKHPSICESQASSNSTIESEDESSHMMEMCSDDRYFSGIQALSESPRGVSSMAEARTTRCNSSPHSVGLRSADDSEDVVLVGTF